MNKHLVKLNKTAAGAGLALLAAVWTFPALAGSTMATTGNSGALSASASLNFRIEIPAVMRVTPVTQQERLVISQRHIDQGYVDLDAGTSVKLTNNTRSGYQLTASYNPQLLSRVEVRVANQQLASSSGFGSMRVVSGMVVDKLVAIGYRLYLAPGVSAGEYRWPVALAFSLAMT